MKMLEKKNLDLHSWLLRGISEVVRFKVGAFHPLPPFHRLSKILRWKWKWGSRHVKSGKREFWMFCPLGIISANLGTSWVSFYLFLCEILLGLDANLFVMGPQVLRVSSNMWATVQWVRYVITGHHFTITSDQGLKKEEEFLVIFGTVWLISA